MTIQALRGRQRRRSRAWVLCLALGLLAGCGGGSGLSASSTCSDFASASPEDQGEAISKLASEFETPDLATPLGSPNVSYYCSSNPELTLENLFQQYKETEEAEG